MKKLTKIAVGALGGLAGAFLMGEAHEMISKLSGARPAKGEDATEKVADAAAKQFTGRKLRHSTRKVGGQVVHYAFGAALGASYALFADSTPQISAAGGALFGAAVYAGAHAILVPALGLAPTPFENGARREGAELSSHLVFGMATEAVRRLLH